MSGTTSDTLDIDPPAFERVRRLLRARAGIELADLTLSRPSLEDAYLQLVAEQAPDARMGDPA